MVTLGYELECVCPQLPFLEAMRARYPFVPRAGFVMGGERDGSGVTITDDRSIKAKADDRLEIRSGIYPDAMSAIRGFTLLTDILTGLSAKTPSLCGLHLHVGLPDLDWGDYFEALAILRNDWLPVQNAFYDLAYPTGWRDGLVRRLEFAGPWYDDDIDAMARMGPMHCRDNRYRFRSLNVYSLKAHRTLECRVFPATLDVFRFAKFVQRFAAWADAVRPGAYASEVAAMRTEYDRLRQEFDLWTMRITREACRAQGLPVRNNGLALV